MYPRLALDMWKDVEKWVLIILAVSSEVGRVELWVSEVTHLQGKQVNKKVKRRYSTRALGFDHRSDNYWNVSVFTWYVQRMLLFNEDKILQAFFSQTTCIMYCSFSTNIWIYWKTENITNPSIPPAKFRVMADKILQAFFVQTTYMYCSFSTNTWIYWKIENIANPSIPPAKFIRVMAVKANAYKHASMFCKENFFLSLDEVIVNRTLI